MSNKSDESDMARGVRESKKKIKVGEKDSVDQNGFRTDVEMSLAQTCSV